MILWPFLPIVALVNNNHKKDILMIYLFTNKRRKEQKSKLKKNTFVEVQEKSRVKKSTWPLKKRNKSQQHNI